MFLPPKDKQNNINLEGLGGLPEHYPTPDIEDMLFYIQRNQNENTVIYKINKNNQGDINSNDPISIYWKQYNNNREDSEINYIQRKLAYGIDYKLINPTTIKIQIVSYPDYKIYVSKKTDGNYRTCAKINNQWAELSNVYVYAEEFGAFPLVKYLELYGIQKDGMPCYEKIKI